ncbi:cell division control protein 6 homolog B-like [Fagus crenata]
MVTVNNSAIRKPNTCILIGIANAIDPADCFLPRLQSLNCKPMVVTFRAYSKDQILKMLHERLMELPYTVFQPQALELYARKVAAASGDMRKALCVCRVYKAESYWFCPGAGPWGHRACRLSCHHNEDKYPHHHPLLPKDIHKKAINYQAASIVSSSIQPHQNLATLKSIGEKLGPDAQLAWAKHHVEKGCIGKLKKHRFKILKNR